MFNENAGTIPVTVTRTAGGAGAVSVQYASLGGDAGTAIGGASCTAGVDYVNASGTLNFATGVTSQTINVTLCNDNIFEITETVFLALSNPTGGATVGSPTLHVVTIMDEDPPPSISINDITVNEPAGTATLTVSQNTTSAVNTTFSFATGAGGDTAMANADYTTTNGTRTIPAGATTATISIPITNDSMIEPLEIFTVTLSAPVNATISDATGIVTIIDDDAVACPSLPIDFGQSVGGRLTPSSCLIDGDRTDLYTFSGTAGQQIVVDMSSDQFSTRILLLDAGNNVIAQTPQNDNFSDSRLPASGYFTLPANGLYTIRARGQFGGTGSYLLSLYQRPQTACTYSFQPRTDADAAGGRYSFFVVTQPGCPSADQPANFGPIYQNLTYRGGLVRFDVPQNPNLLSRQGTIAIAGQIHTINQYGTGIPSNDNFAAAQQLTGNSSNAASGIDDDDADAPLAPVLGYNTTATAEMNEPLHAANPVARSVWYFWSPPVGTSGLYSFTTSGSSFDTVMAIYACPATGTCSFANITRVGSNDNTTFYDKSSKVNFRANSGTRYMIAIDGKTGATGATQLAWRSYERLFRLYLQNYNGFPSAFEPASITATSGASVISPAKISLGVYEFSLPANNAVYTVVISGPTGIVWDPNNISLPSAQSGGQLIQNVVANAQNQTPRPVTGYILNITSDELAALSVVIGSSRGPNARPPEPCSPLGSEIFNLASYATYQCTAQPQTLHEIVPNRVNKLFTLPALVLDLPVDAPYRGTREAALVASNSATFSITGRVLAGGAGTAVDLAYTPFGTNQELSVRTLTSNNGDYAFPNLVPNTYRVTATRTGLVFLQPPLVNLQSNRVIDIGTESSCTYTTEAVSPIPAAGGVGQFNVLTSHPSCEWTATSDVPWIIINSGEIVGNEPVQFTVGTNPGAARAGMVRIRNRPEPVVVEQLSSAAPSLEGDTGDATGAPAGGDGVQANDVTLIRRFALGLQTAVTSPNQFQRADCAPRDMANNLFGDGRLDATDVTVARRYAIGLDPPTAAAGPTAAVVSRSELLKPGRPFNPFYAAPQIRAVDAEAAAGSKVSVSIDMDSLGDAASASFTVNFDPSVFKYASAKLGDGAPAGSRASLNTNESGDGRLAVLVDATDAYQAGLRRMLTLTFTVADDAAPGNYAFTFSGDLASLSVSDAVGEGLRAKYVPGIVTVVPARIQMLNRSIQ